MSSVGYTVRIATRQWVDQVFNRVTYYTSIRRKWQAGDTLLFVHKTITGDAIVGYGIIDNVCDAGKLPDAERSECEKFGWGTALILKYVVRFDRPLPTKQTFLREARFRGRCCHGLRLDKEQLATIISQAELLQG